MSSVYFGGSRNLQSPSPAINQVVGAVVMSGQSVHVGCCIGADALVIASALLWGRSSLVVFASFSAQGQGAISASSSMPAVAASLGAQVHWLAGGPLAVPVQGRLINRSLAAMAGCSQAVFFSQGSGSLAIASHAVGQGKQVFAFGDLPSPIPQQAGQWVPAQFMGFQCWQWSSAQLSFI